MPLRKEHNQVKQQKNRQCRYKPIEQFLGWNRHCSFIHPVNHYWQLDDTVRAESNTIDYSKIANKELNALLLRMVRSSTDTDLK
jgi:hypothetical protein